MDTMHMATFSTEANANACATMLRENDAMEVHVKATPDGFSVSVKDHANALIWCRGFVACFVAMRETNAC